MSLSSGAAHGSRSSKLGQGPFVGSTLGSRKTALCIQWAWGFRLQQLEMGDVPKAESSGAEKTWMGLRSAIDTGSGRG